MTQQPAMTPDAFKRWLEHVGFTVAEAADALGMSRQSVYDYLHGTTAIPRTVQLATEAVTVRRIKPKGSGPEPLTYEKGVGPGGDWTMPDQAIEGDPFGFRPVPPTLSKNR